MTLGLDPIQLCPCGHIERDPSLVLCRHCGHALERHPDRGVPAGPKPCARRLNTRPARWCYLDAGHDGDCEYLSRSELPPAFADLGPQRQPRWGR